MKKLILFAILLFVIANVIYLKLSFSFLIREEKFFTYILIGLGLVLLIFAVLKKHKKLKAYSSILTVIAIMTLFTGEGIKSYQLKTANNKAKMVIDGLKEYHKNEKNFPDELAILSPKYIEEVPKYFIGFSSDEFQYENKNDYYVISYRDFLNTKYYNSKNDSWVVVD
ncbi:hypothetical protein [Aquimarina macrocephali]|uniref:hypothetical protein n=1 Tax=Aquimarina macrocephali TaxID=666563 RepID=UPI003F66DB4C